MIFNAISSLKNRIIDLKKPDGSVHSGYHESS